MKAEELLKNISNLLKKHEDFLNNNPEMFYAIQDRLVKASDDDEEDSNYDWANIGKDENQDEGDDESGYGDELFDKIPSDEGEDEDQQYIRESNGEDDGEDDDASRWLREHGGDTGDEDQSGFDYDPKAARESDEEGYTPDANENGNVQQEIPKTEEPKRSSSRMVDWKPQDKYAPEHQKAIEAAMKEGYSHREAERMAGAHKAPSDFYGALRGSTRPSEPSSKMLEQLKGHAHGWLKNAETKAAENAEAEVNPVKYASGKAIASHDAAHKDFDAAHNEFLQSDNLKGLTGRARHQAIQGWKKDWEEKNPQHREKAIAAADTGKVFSEATKARDERRKEGEQAILGAGKSFGTGTTGEYSQAAAGGDDEPVSGQAAGQMVGGEKSDEGGYTTNIKTDPAAVFAERNPEYVKHLQSKLNPDQQQRLSGINAIKIKKGTP
jgi:hypothetical protein